MPGRGINGRGQLSAVRGDHGVSHHHHELRRAAVDGFGVTVWSPVVLSMVLVIYVIFTNSPWSCDESFTIFSGQFYSEPHETTV